MLKKRVITAMICLPIVIIAVWFDAPLPWFTLLAALWGALAALEFYRISGVTRSLPLACFGIIWVVLFILSPHFDFAFLMPLLLTSAVTLSLLLVVFYPRKEGAFHNWAGTMVGILYAGWMLSFLVTLRLEAGRNWLFLVLFVTFASDTAAFFIGRALGRHHLAPRVSPHKTCEGAVGGVFGGMVVSLLFVLPSPLQLPFGYGQALLLGILISIFGQLGDLAESLLKRSCGVKESGSLMPGHGGLLDRMDSVVFAGIVVYYFFLFS